jgi:DNA-binding CsgD family transcriptional regulator
MTDPFVVRVTIDIPRETFQVMTEIGKPNGIAPAGMLLEAATRAAHGRIPPVGDLGDQALWRTVDGLARLTVLGEDVLESLWRRGMTQAEIARYFKLSVPTMRRLLRGGGFLETPGYVSPLGPRSRPNPRAAMTGRVPMFRRLHAEGHTTAEIARAMDLSPETISRAHADYGLTPNGRAKIRHHARPAQL